MIKTNYFRTAIILMIMAFLFSSCASIVTKSAYPLSINSNPTNAKINIINKKGNEIYSGNTPAVVRLPASNGFFSKAEYQVKFSADGYDEMTMPVTFSLDGWYLGNILFGGLIGMLIIDPATGAMWKIDSEHLSVTLKPSASSAIPEIRIFDINEIPEDWKELLVKLN